MSDDPIFTGERFIPGAVQGAIRAEHLHRYALASRLAHGKSVLDIACGEGYGAALLREQGAARSVIGVDIDVATVDQARRRYRDIDALSFRVGSTSGIPLPDSSVELAVSFETLEHHDQHKTMIAELRRVLTPDGLMILSSPNRPVYSAHGYSNPFHVKELDLSELTTLLTETFPAVRLWGQKTRGASFVYRLTGDAPSHGEHETVFDAITSADNATTQKGVAFEEPAYFIAVCAASDTSLDAALSGSMTSMFADSDDDLIQAEITRVVTDVAQGYEAELKRVNQQLHETQQHFNVVQGELEVATASLVREQEQSSRMGENVAALENRRVRLEEDMSEMKTLYARSQNELREWENSGYGRARQLLQRWKRK